jgi:FkbM family methyltransferase
MDSLLSWLKRKETVIIIPILDSTLVLTVRIFYLGYYLGVRLLFRLLLGRNERNKLFTRKGIVFNYEFDIVPAFYEIKLLNAIMKCLKRCNNNLVKIRVPKYNYTAYCPVSKNDLINMSIREDELIQNFCPNKGDTFIDIGAHIGRYTLISSKRVGAIGKVLAIEADPENFKILCRNIELNNLSNVTSLNATVYSDKRKIMLYKSDKLGNSIYNTLSSERLGYEGFLEVETDTLDQLIESKHIKPEKINWIKIDVEGAELEVLKGATNILAKSTEISLLIEIHLVSRGKTLYESIVEFLAAHKIYVQFEVVHFGGERHIIARKGSK